MNELHRRRPGRRPARLALTASLAVSALALPGCTVGPDFHQPSVFSPSSWFAAKAQPTVAPTLASVPVAEPIEPNWWAAFQDPELTSLERRVAASNLDVRLQTIRLAESRQQRRITSADEFPQINGAGSYTRERLSSNGAVSLLSGSAPTTGAASGTAAVSQSTVNAATTSANANGAQSFPTSRGIPAFDLFQYGLDASWEIDLWGRVRRAIENADATVEASAEARRDTLLATLAEVATDYIQLRGAQAQLAISRQNVETAQSALKLTQDRAAGGLTTDLDVANAAAQVASTQATIPPLEEQVHSQINRLSFLLGETPGALANELSTPKPVPPIPPTVPVGLPSELALRRPDIREADARLHAATAEIGVATAQFFPSITLSGSFDIQALQLKNLASWNSRTYSFGPNLSVPLFEGGRLVANLDLTKEQQKEAAVTYQRTVLNAFHEVDNALTNYQQEQARRAALQQAVAQSQRALDLARAQYTQGIADFLQVLTAEQTLLGAQQNLVNSTTQESANLVTLYKALGGGWETSFPRVEVTPRPAGIRF